MPQVSKIIMATLAAAISVGAALPASAWGETRCAVAAGLTAGTISNWQIARHCKEYIVGQGIISKGPEAGQQWSKAFIDLPFHAADDPEVRLRTYKQASGTKYIWKVRNINTIRTKEIAEKDIDSHMKRIGFEKIDQHLTSKSKSYKAKRI